MFQKMLIAGDVVAEPRYMPTQSNQRRAMFTVAVLHYKHSGVETYHFHITAWGRDADFVREHVHQGTTVIVSGTLRGDSETHGPRMITSEDGRRFTRFELTADTVKYIP